MFGESAVRLAGLTGALFGWRPDEFWASTPEELATVLRAWAGESDRPGPADATALAQLMEQFPDG